jgi:hypothetical protein
MVQQEGHCILVEAKYYSDYYHSKCELMHVVVIGTHLITIAMSMHMKMEKKHQHSPCMSVIRGTTSKQFGMIRSFFFCLSHPIAFIQIQAIAYVQLLFKAHLFMCV